MIIIDDDGIMHKVLPMDTLDKIKAEVEKKIEQERFARSVFRGEEKDAIKAEQCTGSIFAYNNVIKLIDKYKTDKTENDHKCHNCKHYTSGERDGSCGSYICKQYSGWESEG